MNNTKQPELLEKAIAIAVKMHAGQRDKAGEPYIFHPLRLMLQMETDSEKMVAVLHDIIEDTDFTIDNLHSSGFPEEVIQSVGLLTKQEPDTYDEFIRKIKPHPLACRVKIADIRDNSRIERIPNPTEKDFSRLEKYKKALAFLES